MQNIYSNNFRQDAETISSELSVAKDTMLIQESEECNMQEASVDAMLCDTEARLITGGFTTPACTDEYIMFLNAGGEASTEENSYGMSVMADKFFKGGEAIRASECILEAGGHAFIYQSARVGNFCYQIDNLEPGEYFVDLHFVEIVNTAGPKGMRVFNVYMQEKKVLSNFDIFSTVGANKPLQLVDLRVSVKEDGVIVIRFEGVQGSPVISGICIRKAPNLSVPTEAHENLKCTNCNAEIRSAKKNLMLAKFTAKYEKKIEELSMQCKRKTDECYEAWMSLTAANEQLERVKMELDTKMICSHSLDQAMQKQSENVRTISSSYENGKKSWAAAVTDFAEKLKIMKNEHYQLSLEAHECADAIPELNNMVTAVQSLVTQCEDLKKKYSEEQAKRRKLYNEVQEAKGNIRVFCRCRPLNEEEISAGCATVVDFEAAQDGIIRIRTGGSSKKTFKFDRVYTIDDDQVNVFADASSVVMSVLDGNNVCIFASGQTGTGKTFTMEGTEQNRGVNYRTLEQLFEIARERSDTFTYDIYVSMLEVYNEQIRDLLATSPTSEKLKIKHASEGCHHVLGIVEAKVENISEVRNVLQAGSNARAIGCNNVNEHSSRSHCLLCIVVRAKNLISSESTQSKLWLVDLAGSERLAKTDAQGERLKEAQNINKSLSALGDVVSFLAAKSNHIPYRNSKLTHLLQDSLGGNSKTLMFVQISPSDRDLGETLSSLNFATSVRGVELGPIRKQMDTGELQKMKMMLDKVRQESRTKDETLQKLEENLQTFENKAKNRDHIFKSQHDKIKEIEGLLEMKTNMQSQLDRKNLLLSERLKEREEICSNLQQKVEVLEANIGEQQQQQSGAANFPQKIKNLESKLLEQVQESELHSTVLQDKVKELERKLEEEESNEEMMLHEKIKELEDKLREQERRSQNTLSHDHNEITEATPNQGKFSAKDELLGEAEPHILRSSNSVHSFVSQGSVKLKSTSTIQERSRKRVSSIGYEENRNFTATYLTNSKMRKSDPPRVARIARKKPVVAAQGPCTSKRTTRDQVQEIKKERKKIWS